MARTREIETIVAGLEYRVTVGTQERLAQAAPISAKLVREPDNEEDENAIKVILTEKPFRGYHVGYVPRSIAKALAFHMDVDDVNITEVWVLSVDPDTESADLLIRFQKMATGSEMAQP